MATNTTNVAIPGSRVASPCIGVCQLDPASGFCRGCLRTGDEIAVWRDADDGMRRDILARIATRRAGGCAIVTKPRSDQD